MKTSIAILTLASASAPPANAQTAQTQTSNAPKRLRTDQASQEWERRERQPSQKRRQIGSDEGDQNIRKLDARFMSMTWNIAEDSLMSVPFAIMDQLPEQQIATSQDRCGEHADKDECWKEDLCSWDGLECYTHITLNFDSFTRFNPVDAQPAPSAMSLPFEVLELEMSMPVEFMEAPTVPTVPTVAKDRCKVHNKKQCRKAKRCTYDRENESCYTSHIKKKKRTVTGQMKKKKGTAKNHKVQPADLQMSMPIGMMEVRTDTENPCEVLNKKKCARDEACAWDGEEKECHAKTAGVKRTRTTADFQTPAAEPTDAGEDPCEALNKKQCRRDESCTWDMENDDCYTTPTVNLRRNPSFSVEAAGDTIDLQMSMIVVDTASSADEEEVPCAELSRKKCKKNADRCTWADPFCTVTPASDSFVPQIALMEVDSKPTPYPSLDSDIVSTPFPTDPPTSGLRGAGRP